MARNIGPRRGPDGQTQIVRNRYRAEDYTMPAQALKLLAEWDGALEGFDELAAMRDGPFPNEQEFERVQADGKTWVVMRNFLHDWCFEVEFTRAGLGQIRPVAPERAYQIALAFDATRPQRVVYEE